MDVEAQDEGVLGKILVRSPVHPASSGKISRSPSLSLP